MFSRIRRSTPIHPVDSVPYAAPRYEVSTCGAARSSSPSPWAPRILFLRRTAACLHSLLIMFRCCQPAPSSCTSATDVDGHVANRHDRYNPNRDGDATLVRGPSRTRRGSAHWAVLDLEFVVHPILRVAPDCKSARATGSTIPAHAVELGIYVLRIPWSVRNPLVPQSFSNHPTGSDVYLCLSSGGASYTLTVDGTPVTTTRSGSDSACTGYGADTLLYSSGVRQGNHDVQLKVSASASEEFRFWGGIVTMVRSSASILRRAHNTHSSCTQGVTSGRFGSTPLRCRHRSELLETALTCSRSWSMIRVLDGTWFLAAEPLETSTPGKVLATWQATTS